MHLRDERVREGSPIRIGCWTCGTPLLLGLFATATPWAAEAPAHDLEAGTPSSSGQARGSGAAKSALGDSLFSRGQLRQARAAYLGALEIEPHRFGLLCRLAQIESDLGEDAEGDERSTLVDAAIAHARESVAVAPDSAGGHVWLAAALGRKALKLGPKKKLAYAREIKSEVERGIALDPNIARAYHMRAIWNREVASLNLVQRAAARAMLGGVPKGASMENAIRDFERAIALDPGSVIHQLELGRTYAQVHRAAEARRALEAALALPPASTSRDAKYQSEARELLRRLPGSD